MAAAVSVEGVMKAPGNHRFGYSRALFQADLETFPMLEATLAQLETVIDDLLQRNQQLSEHCTLLEQQLQQAREENDNLQLAALEQEDRQGATLARLQALLDRAASSSAA
jgi:phage shock protein A